MKILLKNSYNYKKKIYYCKKNLQLSILYNNKNRSFIFNN